MAALAITNSSTFDRHLRQISVMGLPSLPRTEEYRTQIDVTRQLILVTKSEHPSLFP